MAKIEIPNDFLCPITNDIMADPVTASDGKVYERSAIGRFIKEALPKQALSPITKQPLSLNLDPNDKLKEQIQTFLKEKSVCSFEEFIEAVKSGQVSKVMELNYLETYLNQEDEVGLSPLHYATQSGHVEMFDFLMADGAVVASSSKNNISPLYIAVLLERDEIISKLLTKGASPHLPNNEGVTPIRLAASKPKILPLLIPFGFPKPVDLPSHFYCPLSKLPMDDPVKIADGSIFNRPSIQGHFAKTISNPITGSPLENSILIPEHELQKEIFQCFLENNILWHDDYIELIIKGDFRTLVTKKIPDIYSHLIRNGLSLASHAAMGGHVEVLSMLLETGANPNFANNDNTTPLHFASANGHYSCVKVLINKRAKLLEKEGAPSAVHFAAQYAKAEMLKLLLTLNPNFSLDAPGGQKFTPLHYAAISGNLDTLQFLLDRNVSKLTFDSYGWTPLHHAALRGHISFIENFDMTIEEILNLKTFAGTPFLVVLACHPKGAQFALKLLQDRKDIKFDELLAQEYEETPQNFCGNFLFSLLNNTNGKDYELALSFLLQKNLAILNVKMLYQPKNANNLFAGQTVLFHLSKSGLGIKILKAILSKEKMDLYNEEQLTSLEKALVKAASNKRSPIFNLASFSIGCSLLHFLYVTNSVKFDPNQLNSTIPSTFMLLCSQEEGVNFLDDIITKYPTINSIIKASDLCQVHTLTNESKNPSSAAHCTTTPFFSLSLNPVGKKILLQFFETQPDLKYQISTETLMRETHLDDNLTLAPFYALSTTEEGIRILKYLIDAQSTLLEKIDANIFFKKRIAAANKTTFSWLAHYPIGQKILQRILNTNNDFVKVLATMILQESDSYDWLSGFTKISIRPGGLPFFKMILKLIAEEYPKIASCPRPLDFIFSIPEISYLIDTLTGQDILEISSIHPSYNKRLISDSRVIKKISNMTLLTLFEKIPAQECKKVFCEIYDVIKSFPSRSSDFLSQLSLKNSTLKKQILEDKRLINRFSEPEWVAFLEANPDDLDEILLGESFWLYRTMNTRKLLLHFSNKSLCKLIKNERTASLFLPEDFLTPSQLFIDVEIRRAMTSQQVLLSKFNHKQFLELVLSDFDIACILLNDIRNLERWTERDFDIIEKTYPENLERIKKLIEDIQKARHLLDSINQTMAEAIEIDRQRSAAQVQTMPTKSENERILSETGPMMSPLADLDVSLYIMGNRVDIPKNQDTSVKPVLKPGNNHSLRHDKPSQYSWKKIAAIGFFTLLGLVGLGLIATGVGTLLGIGIFASVLTAVNFLGLSLGTLGVISTLVGVTGISSATLIPYVYFSNTPDECNVSFTSSKEPEMFSPAWTKALLAQSTLSPDEKKTMFAVLTYQPPGVDFTPIFSQKDMKKPKKSTNKVVEVPHEWPVNRKPQLSL